MNEINACYNDDGLIFCANQIDDWCLTCPNIRKKVKVRLAKQSLGKEILLTREQIKRGEI